MLSMEESKLIISRFNLVVYQWWSSKNTSLSATLDTKLVWGETTLANHIPGAFNKST